jgi:hypothetical protein
VLLDALLSLFITGIILLAAFGSISSVLGLSSVCIERGRAIIEERNDHVMKERIYHE